MFNITTPSAGVVNFSGTGTANFNQSLGTSNSFNVGSSTNLGVNASASSTEDYMSTGSASLDLAGTSRLQQTIGTATSAFNASTIAESSSRAADIAAHQEASRTMMGDSWSSEWNDTYTSEQGWEYQTAQQVTDSGFTKGEGYYNTTAGKAAANAAHGEEWDGDTNGDYASQEAWQAAWDTEYQTSSSSNDNFQDSTSWTTRSEEAWQEQYETEYAQTYTSAFETATASANQAVAQTTDQGVIKGAFTTTESGSAQAAMNALADSIEEGASAEASAEYGVDFASRGTDYQDMNESEWTAAYEAKYQMAFSSAYSEAQSQIQRESVSNVDVAGIGVIADVNAAASSNFTATSQLIEGAARDGNGNGNASAGANLATSSYANQSNSTTANAFMQAFSGGLPEPEGDLVITGISGTQANGYTVEGTRTTTTNHSSTYTVDGNGDVTNVVNN